MHATFAQRLAQFETKNRSEYLPLLPLKLPIAFLQIRHPVNERNLLLEKEREDGTQ
jgi:hypothetical protein